ncbi:MAG TPA: apolipoprotein N-acyltransferase, partial [Pirellulales bacterium]|nr:apolipoprotein N-acyltransferase [Pirellulales bacterium]
AAPDGEPSRNERRQIWLPALTGSVLLYAAFPPLDAWPLAWLAPIAWLVLVRRRKLPGRRPYAVLWLAGIAFWLGVLHWLRLPHPATSFGWLALSFYLGCYLPVFVGLSRVAVHRLHWPLMVAAPIVWTGLELAQSHLLTGFNMAALGHSQYRWLALIQCSDLAGGYAVSFLVMFVAACLASTLPDDNRRWRAWPLLPLGLMLAAALGYGHYRLGQPAGRQGPTIALIQGSIDTELKHDPALQDRIYPHYFGLSQQALARQPQLDLIVWPETMFRDSLFISPPEGKLPAEWQGTRAEFERIAAQRREWISEQPARLHAPVLLGLDTLRFGSGEPQRYNSALLVDRQGRLGPRYDKTHPVMFGEYVPFARQLPWLARLSPIGAGIDCGQTVPAFEVSGARLAANICYESAIPHVIRGQVERLRQAGEEPDILVNLTNDGWFWGSSELDLHLTCGVFRAVECRKPFLIAANTGFSAWIDSDGRIVERGPRRAEGVIIARPRLDNRTSPYTRWGDWASGGCLLLSCVFAVVGWRDRFFAPSD